MLKQSILICLLSLLLFSIGCLPFVEYEQSTVLIENVDIDASLKVAEAELKKANGVSVLGLWSIRNQIITPAQAIKINNMYLSYIDGIKSDFGLWHIAWAIADFYRLGDGEVQTNLAPAYSNAVSQITNLNRFKKVAREHILGDKIYMGDIHSLARRYVRTHVVAPKNDKYLQSYEEYLSNQKKK